MNLSDITQKIKAEALRLGFDAVGISKAEKLAGFDVALDQWLAGDFHAGMSYMERNKDKRADPTLLVDGAKSVVSLLTSYFPEKLQDESYPQIAKYAYGTDYHFVIKDKMELLWDFIKTEFPELDGRIFVDSAPVSDKLWAVQAGLGWLGKNSCLINREMGSFVFISELIINLELNYDQPYRSNFCGGCTKCIDACPTQAITQPGVIDSNKCISYLTIENKEETIPEQFKDKMANRLFGCDICQDVCPWNKKPLISSEPRFLPQENKLRLNIEDWEQMENSEFKALFKSSALTRAKLKGLKRNAEFLKKS